MAKLVPYRSDRNRKLGFCKVGKSGRSEKQLDLFQQGFAKQRALPLQQGKDHFTIALECDGVDDRLAQHHYLQAIEKESHKDNALCNLGIVYARQGQSAKAVDCFSQALLVNARHIEAHFNLGNMYFDLGNHFLAASHYQIAREIDPSLEDVHYNLALAHLELRQSEQAKDALETYLALCAADQRRSAQTLLMMLEAGMC